MQKPPRLPPLSALRMFEAAARHPTFSAAADELAVTHGAVSQQVRALEEWLGVSLFQRSGRRVTLTPEGVSFAATANEALCRIGDAAAILRRRTNPNRLTITTMPSFAARWLAPRISRFLDVEPGVEFSIVTTAQVLDFARDGVDVAIRVGFGPYPEANAVRLMADTLLVVASPNYARGELPTSPEALASHPLIREDYPFWNDWFRGAGLSLNEPRNGLVFNDSSLALQAAIDGRGIAVTRRSIASGELAAGRLVKVFPLEVPTELSYWYVTADGVRETPLMQRFRAWIMAEVAAG
ncbi:transcriptional regulator GcvA [Niveibacterium umoris]|uniref:LysR family glycine cleavage system transcriptional activator n=1 Tax=Niveibacterium umoris TaxID=1193620 RepID=A0A840BNN3_9RHOO|nr:transcriptional regulator GcvA [Niveibacterium umoris]MBB4014915.1 LysR family glycine cleavage system transcriptional activator [Niveibacterium umoris]